ncbi:MAG: hypothetical protein FJX42_02150 [Alphaproteobacteria bacterium]|nr:hypothetical protein [Alphaproteobacteria bacterium]
MANTQVEFCGLTFKNPVVVASIEPTNSPAQIKNCIDAGAAGTIVKTLTDIEDMSVLTQNSRYAVLNERGEIIRGKIPHHFTFYSRSGYSSTYYKDWVPHLKECQAYAQERGAHVIGSVGAKSLESWADIARTIEDCGIKLIELNFGCPHPAMMPGVHGGSMIGQVADVAAEVTRRVVEAVDVPIMVKLTPDQSQPLAVARAVKDAGAAAVTATNRYTGFAVDIETGEPRLDGPAGIGGPWTKPLSLRWVHEIHSKLGMPISGSNGIFDHRDVVEFIMSGAGIVQVGSVLMIKGVKWLGKIVEGFERFMDEKGYADVKAMHGIASRKAASNYQHHFGKPRIHSAVSRETCKNPSCTVCIQMCFYEALSQRKDDTVGVHSDNCIGCEMCYNVCGFDSIRLAETTKEQAASGKFFSVPKEGFIHDFKKAT